MKKVIMKDIAEKAKVSLTTVSYILNDTEGQKISEETRCKVLSIAKELGYVPNLTAKSLASKKSGLIGIVVLKDCSKTKLWKDFLYCKFINEVESLLKQKGYHILVSSVEASSPEFDIILQRELDGVFLLDVNEDAFYKISKKFNVPIIIIDSYLDDNLFNKIVPDFESAIHMAKTLLGNQHSFLIADKVNNMGILEKITHADGINGKDIILVEKEEDVKDFVKMHQGLKGIVINEYLGSIAANYTDPENLAVICTCGCSTLLPPAVKKVDFKEDKALKAVEIMMSYIKNNFFESKSKYTMIEVN